MRTVKQVFDFYIFGNIHVGLATFCLTKISLETYGISNNLVPVFVLFSTILVYNFIRLRKVSINEHWLSYFINENKKAVLVLSIVSFAVILLLSFFLNIKSIIALIPFGLAALFYVNPIPFKNTFPFSLRSIAFFKIFLIAFTWAGVTVIFPLINHKLSIGFNEIILFIQRFLIIVVITIPFDIRDLSYDHENLKTLPQVIGLERSKVFGLLFLMLFLGLELFKTSSDNIDLRINLVIALISIFFLIRSNQNQHKYYCAFYVESIPILWFFLYLLK
ncbi:MAG: hypothetical protein KJO83_02830 [Bacteroidia bacterium]|nr:hypothetical protein [Bacteroidia bacterium]